MKQQRGFTLVELMVVVAIIGILAAIAIPSFIRFQAKSKQAEARTNLKAIFTGERAFFSEKDRYSSLTGEIGFAPERGNRYLFDLGPAAGGFAACGTGALEPRTAATIAAGTYSGIAADVSRYGVNYVTATLVANIGAGAGTVTWLVSGGSTTAMTSGQPGYDIANCPSCDFNACAIGNVDADFASDLWFIGTQFSTLAAAACAEATPAGQQEQAGAPINAKSDVSCYQ